MNFDFDIWISFFESNEYILESKDKLILSNQNNHLYFINKNNGNILKLIPTEETVVKNKFINNISLDNESTFFLNTFGSLYSLDNNKLTTDKTNGEKFVQIELIFLN